MVNIVEITNDFTAAGSLPEKAAWRTASVDVEVTSVLRRSILTGSITEQRAGQALQDLADLPVERVSHLTLLHRVWELRSNYTAYDACYIAVAELFHAPLLTYDAKMAAGPGARCLFEVFPARDAES